MTEQQQEEKEKARALRLAQEEAAMLKDCCVVLPLSPCVSTLSLSLSVCVCVCVVGDADERKCLEISTMLSLCCQVDTCVPFFVIPGLSLCVCVWVLFPRICTRVSMHVISQLFVWRTLWCQSTWCPPRATCRSCSCSSFRTGKSTL